MSTTGSGETERNTVSDATPSRTAIFTRDSSWRGTDSGRGNTHGRTAVSMRASGERTK